jgi:hypothetical protein
MAHEALSVVTDHAIGESIGRSYIAGLSELRLLAVTIEAKAHGEWRSLLDGGHRFDRAVAGLTRHTALDMRRVIEVREVG